MRQVSYFHIFQGLQEQFFIIRFRLKRLNMRLWWIKSYHFFEENSNSEGHFAEAQVSLHRFSARFTKVFLFEEKVFLEIFARSNVNFLYMYIELCAKYHSAVHVYVCSFYTTFKQFNIKVMFFFGNWPSLCCCRRILL